MMNKLFTRIHFAGPVFFLATCFVLASMVPATTAHGALALYQFTGSSSAPNAYNIDPNTTVSNFIVFDEDPDDCPYASDFGFVNGRAYARAMATDGSTQAAALTDDDYFTFTVDVITPGKGLFLESMALQLDGVFAVIEGVVDPGDTFTAAMYIQSSVDGFGPTAPVLGTISKTFTAPDGTLSYSWTGADLSAEKFQGLSDITFRFTFSDDIDVDAALINIDNVGLYGTVQDVPDVPEPSTIALLLMGVAGLFAIRRRK